MKKVKRKSRMGRPPLAKDEAKTRKVFFRVEPPFYVKIEAAASAAGKPVSTWIRDTVADLLRSE